ncbi:MAG: hypothetical protein AB7G93_20925 [Bdellovibrionales bacterium]
MRTLFCIALICTLSTPVCGWAKGSGAGNKVELEDIDIKGEANRFNGRLTSRARNNLDGRILIRKDFRDRINEDLPAFYEDQLLDVSQKDPDKTGENP